MEIRLRRKFLKKGCDYYLEGSLKKGTQNSIESHKGQISRKRRALANCIKIAAKKGCANLPDLAL